MSSFAISSSNGPFLLRDLSLSFSVQFLAIPDIVNASLVCKGWNQFYQAQNLWKALSKKEGIPLVSGEERDYRQDFKTLYPITISSKIIGQFFGRVIGKVPPISEERFNSLKKQDPFDEKKSIRDNYVFIVVPSQVARTVDNETPLVLNDSGNLIEPPKQETKRIKLLEKSTTEKQEIIIRFSLKNLKMLSEHPLKGKENMPIFNEYSSNSSNEVFGPFDTRSYQNVTVYFMRKCVIEQSRGKSYADQEELVKSQGFEVTPLMVRALFDAVGILKDGICPDAHDPLTYVRTSDTVYIGNSVYDMGIGGFAPSAGVSVYYGYDDDIDIGVVPGCPAEASAKAPSSDI